MVPVLILPTTFRSKSLTTLMFAPQGIRESDRPLIPVEGRHHTAAMICGDPEGIDITGDLHAALLGFEGGHTAVEGGDITFKCVDVHAQSGQLIPELVDEFPQGQQVVLGRELGEVRQVALPQRSRSRFDG